MSSKPVKIPGPDHPITIAPSRERVSVTVAGQRIGDTREALVQRFRRLTAASLLNYMKDIDPEARRAAVLASAEKDLRQHIPAIIGRI